MGSEADALVNVQTIRRLFTQQHSCGTVSTVAVDDPHALWRACHTGIGGVADRAALDLVCDCVVALHAGRAGCCFHPAKSCLLSRLFPAKRRARRDGDVTHRGARRGCDRRQHSVAVAGLFSLEQEDSSGGGQWRLKAVASYSSLTTACLTRSARARCCRTCASWRGAECSLRC